MEIRLLDGAKEDLRHGWSFYENALPGLGNYFLDHIAEDVNSLRIYAGIHEVVNGYHRLLSKRFPFAIYYLVDSNGINIHAILDCRRGPDVTARRLALFRE